MKRIGVLLCYCDLNIIGPIDFEQVIKDISGYDGVVYAAAHKDMCLDPGLEEVKSIIKKKELDGVVLAICTPSLYEKTFSNIMTSLGLSSSQFELTDLKEQCGPHVHDREGATQKATKVVKDAVSRLRLHQDLLPFSTSIVKRALVIGGGIAGIQAALDIADRGCEVILVEKTPSIGGHMIQYSETFPTLDCPQCIETPKMVECGQHPNIKILAYSEVEEVTGSVGDFTVKIRRKASYVDWEKCNGCRVCEDKCTTKSESWFDRWLPTHIAFKKAIYIPHGQAVPNRPVINTDACRFFTKGKCRLCEQVCPSKAIDFSQQDTIVEENVGAIIVATGFELMPKSEVWEFAEDPDVLDPIAFERLLSPGGPTAGEVIRPSDHKTPKEVVFISCVGSRDPEHGVPYCSRVCCMYLPKLALLYKHAVEDGQAYLFYMDQRTTGKGYEEFVQRAVEEDKVIYLRGRVSKLFRDGEKIQVFGTDTLIGKRVDISCDMVVLGMAMLPSPGTIELAQKLGILTDDFGFIIEAHPKLSPLETTKPGIYVAGTAQGAKDIPDSVAQGSGAASKILGLFSKSELRWGKSKE